MLALNVTWNSSLRDVNNIKILDYTIKIFDGTILREEYTAVGRTSLVAKNLARNRTYVVVIQARNEVGFGETANITATTLLAGDVFSRYVVFAPLCYFQLNGFRTYVIRYTFAFAIRRPMASSGGQIITTINIT